MPFTLKDLKLPDNKVQQLNRALGGALDDVAAQSLQGVCDEAAAMVARMTTGYVIDPVSLKDFTRAVALYRAYGFVGTVPKDIQDTYKSTMDELQAIAGGKRPNLPKVVTPAQNTIEGGWGSNSSVPGRMQ
jgi:hypothetical protein